MSSNKDDKNDDVNNSMKNLAVGQEEVKQDPRNRGDSNTSGEGGIYKQLKELRKLSKNNIYIFECCKCQCFVLLHQPNCRTCQYKNPFVD